MNFILKLLIKEMLFFYGVKVAGGQTGLDKAERIKQLEHDLSVANEVSSLTNRWLSLFIIYIVKINVTYIKL